MPEENENDKTGIWTRCKKWLIGLSSVIGVAIVILTQVIDFWNERVVPANNYSAASEVKEISNNEVVENLKSELLETRMEIIHFVVMMKEGQDAERTDSIENVNRVQPQSPSMP